MKIGQVALGFGADDLGSVMIEENVVSAAGTTYRTSTDEQQYVVLPLHNWFSSCIAPIRSPTR